MSKEKKIFVYDDTARAPSINLAINKFYLESVKNNKHDFVFRIYSHSPGIILGANESVEDVNLEKCLKTNIEVVRRPTGGSFVYVDAQSTLCYSMFMSKNFADAKNIHNIDDIYKSIVCPLRKRLGDNFEIRGNYYLRMKTQGESLPVAGHSIHTTNGAIQFDGIVHTAKPDAEFLSSIAKLRKLYSDGENRFVQMGNDFYNPRGKKIDPPGKLKYVADEKEFLGRMPAITDVCDKNTFIAHLKEVANYFVPSLKNMSNPSGHYYSSFLEDKISDGSSKMKAQGHCFVDFLEPEYR